MGKFFVRSVQRVFNRFRVLPRFDENSERERQKIFNFLFYFLLFLFTPEFSSTLLVTKQPLIIFDAPPLVNYIMIIRTLINFF